MKYKYISKLPILDECLVGLKPDDIFKPDTTFDPSQIPDKPLYKRSSMKHIIVECVLRYANFTISKLAYHQMQVSKDFAAMYYIRDQRIPVVETWPWCEVD